MKFYRIALLIGLLLTMILKEAGAQFPSYYQYSTVISDESAGLLIGEASGERTFNHILEMAGYARLRSSEEFKGDMMETAYVVKMLQQYGYDNVMVDRFGTTRSWQGVSASLWETSPVIRKIADLIESPLMLASGSTNVDTEAELMWVDGFTVSSGFENTDISGKILLTSERPGAMLSRAVQGGALAVISFYSPRPLENSLMIPASSAGGRGGGQTGTLFFVSPREGEALKKRLLAGERIVIGAKAAIEYVDAELQVTSCVIEGTAPMSGEVIITAHLFEGYVKTGGNDNISGSASILEAARVLKTLIDKGSLPRPVRNIRFLWIPEFSGTIPWVAENADLMKRTLCNINLDMVGLSIAEWKSFFVLHRTSYGNAHYVGDVVESLFRYTGETNKVNSVVSGSRFFRPITAPTGTNDPFYYQIESASGGSDHMVFNDLGVMVPGIMMITWPDPFYHTSEDLASRCDPTQLKRTVFITSAAAYSIASAKGVEAIAIAGESASNGIRRMGVMQSAALDMVAKADTGELHSVARHAAGKIRGTALGELLVLNSVNQLDPGSAELKKAIESYRTGIKKMVNEQIEMLNNVVTAIASTYGLPPFIFTQTGIETDAAKAFPVAQSDFREAGYRSYQSISRGIPPEEMATLNIREIADPQEALKLADGANSILDIKHILDAQYSRQTSIDALHSYFNILEKNSLIRY